MVRSLYFPKINATSVLINLYSVFENSSADAGDKISTFYDYTPYGQTFTSTIILENPYML